MIPHFSADGAAVTAVYGVAVGTAATTIACSRIFRKFRAWAHAKALMFGALVSCPYCTSHWLAAAGLFLCAPRPVATGFWPVEVGIAWLVAVAVAAMTSRLIGHVNKTDQERIIEALAEELIQWKEHARANGGGNGARSSSPSPAMPSPRNTASR